MLRFIKFISVFVFCACLYQTAPAQRCNLADFSQSLRKVDTLMRQHSGAKAWLSLNLVTKNGKTLDFYFSQSLEDYPIRPGDGKWLSDCLEANLPEQYLGYKVGKVIVSNQNVEKLAVAPPSSDGKMPKSQFSKEKVQRTKWIDRGISAPKGLDGRFIALWQSHGMYYNVKSGQWDWQRPCIFGTLEDLFTQSYVLPFLVPMLENAGASVILPRERDCSDVEIIVDNDACEDSSGRIHGEIRTSGVWTQEKVGFADKKAVYEGTDNPFTMGTSLRSRCQSSPEKEGRLNWCADIPERGTYALYVSYQTTAIPCPDARYIIHALGGDRTIRVNQTIGAGTWVYLGHFEFDKGSHSLVSLSNLSRSGAYVSGDAIKIGGGYGNIARAALKSENEAQVSGFPRFVEGARYFMQWSGVPERVWSQNEFKDDYRDDFMSRGSWVKYLAGKSRVNPKEDGLGLPVDLSFAMHTDAGRKDENQIVGTLAIYTLKCDGKTVLQDGGNRGTCRELTDLVQTQVVDDIRAQWDTLWQRRQLWNRSYSESRTSGVPAVLLELLSHENFEDMKFGLDPAFRFGVARSCYKAILKYLSMHYSCPYVVQPLPVRCFAAETDNDCITLSWEESIDTLELTARASSFKLFTRIDGNGWDNGVVIRPAAVNGRYTYRISNQSKGHIYSFKIAACNDGGISFPSEILSVGRTEGTAKGKVLVVNNFTRVSGPVWFDSPTYGGFDHRSDCGVAYLNDINYCGEQFDFRKASRYENLSITGFGASYSDYANKIIGGNSFDYPYIHGQALLKAGYSFESCSSSAFSGGYCSADSSSVLDIICGKQCTVRAATRTPLRYEIFPTPLRNAITKACNGGCNVIISGAYIASDAFGFIYPIDYKEGDRTQTQTFLKDVLGFGLRRSHGSTTGTVVFDAKRSEEVCFPCKPCKDSYCVESPDALSICTPESSIYLKYKDSTLPAALRCNMGGYRVAAFGFPIELISDESVRDKIFAETLGYLAEKNSTMVARTH